MPEATQVSHGRARLLRIPVFRGTLCSAFLSVNTNLCSALSLHLVGAVPQDIQSLVGKTDSDGHQVVAVAAICFLPSIQPSSLGSQPLVFLWRSFPFPLLRAMGSVALPASSQHRHVVVTWSFEVTVVG